MAGICTAFWSGQQDLALVTVYVAIDALSPRIVASLRWMSGARDSFQHLYNVGVERGLCWSQKLNRSMPQVTGIWIRSCPNDASETHDHQVVPTVSRSGVSRLEEHIADEVGWLPRA